MNNPLVARRLLERFRLTPPPTAMAIVAPTPTQVAFASAVDPAHEQRVGAQRSIYADRDSAKVAWGTHGRQFTLERADFPRIPIRTWIDVIDLRRQMVEKFGIDLNRANRELRMLVELIDDHLPRSTP